MGAVGRIDNGKYFASSNYSPHKEELSHVFTISVAWKLDNTMLVNFFLCFADRAYQYNLSKWPT